MFLYWVSLSIQIKFIPINKSGPIYTLTQQIAGFDRTGDKLKIKNPVAKIEMDTNLPDDVYNITSYI